MTYYQRVRCNEHSDQKTSSRADGTAWTSRLHLQSSNASQLWPYDPAFELQACQRANDWQHFINSSKLTSTKPQLTAESTTEISISLFL